MANPLVIGVIGGGPLPVQWGKPYEKINITTPHGSPATFIAKTILESGNTVYSLLRHGDKHSLGSDIDYLTNVEAMHLLGCDLVVSLSLIGSLTGGYRLGETVIYDDIIDFRRSSVSFYSRKDAVHVAMAPLVAPALAEQVSRIARELGLPFGGNMVVPEGPRYPTAAESSMFAALGGRLICQTVTPEAFLVRERGMEWFGCGMITDYHVQDPSQLVSTRLIYQNMKPFEAEYAHKILQILERLCHFETRQSAADAVVPSELISTF